MSTIPLEGQDSESYDVPVQETFQPEPIVQTVPAEPLSDMGIKGFLDLPRHVRQEALGKRIEALGSCKDVKDADKVARNVVEAYRWEIRTAHAKRFFWLAFTAMIAAAMFWTARHDWLDEKYRPARSALQKANAVAEAQYKVDVAQVDLKEAKK